MLSPTPVPTHLSVRVRCNKSTLCFNCSMGLQTVVAILQTALLLLSAAQAPNVPSSLHDRAVGVANQAITLAKETLSASSVSSPTATPTISVRSTSPTAISPAQQCPVAPAEPSVPNCNGIWTPRSSGSSDGLDCVVSWQCVAQQSQPSAPASTVSNATTASGPLPGQVLSADYFCLTSINPIVTVDVAAGTPFPSDCYNGAASRTSWNDSTSTK